MMTATASEAFGRVSARKPWIKPAAIGIGAFVVAVIIWTGITPMFHGNTATPNDAGAGASGISKSQSIADARQAFLAKANNMGGADSILAARAVQMVEQQKLIPRIGWGSVDEMMNQATPETQAAYQQWREAIISQ